LSSASPLQLSQPSSQSATTHLPFTHAGVPRDTVQAPPQRPQLLTSFSRSCSQPSLDLPLQLPTPASQVEEPHWPSTQYGVLPSSGHFMSQPPQFQTSDEVCASQPLPGSLSQSSWRESQPIMHLPLTQVGMPLFAGHAMPQPPQLVGSVSRLVSQPSASSVLQRSHGASQLSI
jgi:hypothetical protein